MSAGEVKTEMGLPILNEDQVAERLEGAHAHLTAINQIYNRLGWGDAIKPGENEGENSMLRQIEDLIKLGYDGYIYPELGPAADLEVLYRLSERELKSAFLSNGKVDSIWADPKYRKQLEDADSDVSSSVGLVLLSTKGGWAGSRNDDMPAKIGYSTTQYPEGSTSEADLAKHEIESRNPDYVVRQLSARAFISMVIMQRLLGAQADIDLVDSIVPSEGLKYHETGDFMDMGNMQASGGAITLGSGNELAIVEAGLSVSRRE